MTNGSHPKSVPQKPQPKPKDAKQSATSTPKK